MPSEVMGAGSRLERLRWALSVAESSIGEAEADKRSPLLGQYRALLAEIAELESVVPVGGEVNGLVVLREEIAKRGQSGSASARGASRVRV